MARSQIPKGVTIMRYLFVLLLAACAPKPEVSQVDWNQRWVQAEILPLCGHVVTDYSKDPPLEYMVSGGTPCEPGLPLGETPGGG